MKKILFTVLCIIVSLCCAAQQATLNGNVSDTLNGVKLSNTVVALLHAKDSLLYKFARADDKGHFDIKNIPAGNYVLLVTYPTYADYVESLTLTDTSHIHLNKIILIQKSRLLKEVVIQQKVAAIKMKGDTTEFNAESFKTAANASVEDLLKKLPGIQVNSKGQITAQGETVKKVLVDGEEFFGDDPTLVTKNLRADMVDKVQLYDKKSDQATFTGVDDGEKSKTINIQLKEDKKRGYFGKLAAGAGDHGFHNTEGLFNLFRGKKKIAAYGIASNTGKIGLNWEDQEKFGASSISVDDQGNMEFFGARGDDLDNWSGRYEDNGYPLVQTGGLHYGDKWDQDRKNLNVNYKFMKLYVDADKTISSQNILKDTIYSSNSAEQSKNSIMRNRINGLYELQVDSTSSIKLLVDGGLDHKITSMRNTSEMQKNDMLINNGHRITNNTSDIGKLNANLLWRKKLKKKGRTISLNIAENYSRTNGEGTLDALTAFYQKGQVDSTQRIDQLKTVNNEQLNINTNITYTEPLSKKSSLVFNYGINISNSHSNRNSFNKNNGGKYSLLDSLYSNDYAFNVLTHRGGISYAYTLNNKLRLNLGGNVGFTDFNQKDMFRNHQQERSFVNWYPNASARYSFTQQRRLNFFYQGYTQQPDINQLQPIRTNDDPLNITIGNPNLQPSFNNSFRLAYSDYKVMSGRSIWASVGYNFVSDAISSRSDLDTSGKRTSQAVNVNGNRNIHYNLDMGWKISAWDLRIGGGVDGDFSRNVNYVNSLLNITNSSRTAISFNMQKEAEKKYQFYFTASANYNVGVSSVQSTFRTDYWSYYIEPNLNVYLPWKLQLHGDMNYAIRQRTAVFTGNNNAMIVNAFLAKKFGKKELMQVNFSMNDILNQNIGFDRSVQTNTVTQTRYGTIGRYALLSFIWNFNKLGPGAPKQ
ncbi:outer membrane receptor protein involved in Fe transport [Chitinophaga polysaccharea]|uniref:Outer membrane receptor protein involved in Fe transport n=1 Tax=Chitinophaga polysaccharea TaxID=1293035 RepID=A0A561P781_9BACT|nr:outer membrane beta-barrel family protein [Chitinophaga polysaccharea]TWF33973.1 outer membrane receptor protein involved in Fe transport [Chitinophaga polysaccharea]